jgi:molecular chaperone HtpG
MSTENKSEETFAFSADINQLLSLIINTFYSNKDVFLRELISNASDALDKIRYASLTDSSKLTTNSDLHIKITADKTNNKLIIEDSGIGMSKDDLVNNLGTIAKSGTKAFMESLQAGADVSMIGQFGVGFYSAYLVADEVTVVSRQAGDEDAHQWQSSAGGSFAISKYEGDDLVRGTRLILKIKDDMLDYLATNKLKELIKLHSEFISFPIKLLVEKTEEKQVTDDDDSDDEADDEEGDDSTKVDDVSEEGDSAKKPKKTKTVTEVTSDWEQLNNQQPIWTRKSADVTHEEYVSFYKSISNDWEDHAAVSHFAVEGQLEFKSVLFLPKRAPHDMFQSADNKHKNNMKLYVRRVFIKDNCEDLIPDYLSFVHGIVDSDDVPLNISREMLQQNKIMKVIKKNLTKKCIEMFQNLSEDVDKYKTFYEAFSKNIKLGVHSDSVNRAKLAKLLRYNTTTHENDVTGLADYVERMGENQKDIYYITGESTANVRSSPFLERMRSKNIEVLYLTEPIDEYVIQQLKEYDGKKLVSVTGDLQLDETDEDKAAYEEAVKNTSDLCVHIKTILNDKVEKVIASNRVTRSPCVLVTGQYGMSANMERILKAQALGNSSQMAMMSNKRILEINPTHSIILSINKQLKDDANKSAVDGLIWLLYDTATLSSGFSLDNPTSLSERIHTLIKLGLNIEDPEDPQEVIDISDEAVEKSVEGGVKEAVEAVEAIEAVEVDPVEGCPNTSNDHHKCTTYCQKTYGSAVEEDTSADMEEVD